MKLGWNKGNEVRGHGQEELPHVRGQGRWPRGATPRLRSVVAGRRRPVQGQGRPGEATPCPRPGAVPERSNPRSGGCAGTGGPRGAIQH